MRQRIVFLIILISSTTPGSIARGRKHFDKDDFQESNDDLADSEVRSIIAAIVDAILDGDRRKRSDTRDDDADETNIPSRSRSSLNWNNRWKTNYSLYAKNDIPTHVANISADTNDIDDSLKPIQVDTARKSDIEVNKEVPDVIKDANPSSARSLNYSNVDVHVSEPSSNLKDEQSSVSLPARTRSTDNPSSQSEKEDEKRDGQGMNGESGSGEASKLPSPKIAMVSDADSSGSGDPNHSKRNLILEDENIELVSKRLTEEEANGKIPNAEGNKTSQRPNDRSAALENDESNKEEYENSSQGGRDTSPKDENDKASGGSGESSASGDVDLRQGETTIDRRNEVTEVSLRKSFIRNDSLPVASLPNSSMDIQPISNPNLLEEYSSGEVSASGNAADAEESSRSVITTKDQIGEHSGSGDIDFGHSSRVGIDQIQELTNHDHDQITEVKNKFINGNSKSMSVDTNENTESRNFENYENNNARSLNNYENSNARLFNTFENPQKATNPISYFTSSELTVSHFGKSKKAVIEDNITTKRSEIIGDEDSSGSGTDKTVESSASGIEKGSQKNDVVTSASYSGSGEKTSGSGVEKKLTNKIGNKRHVVSEADTSGSADVEGSQSSSGEERVGPEAEKSSSVEKTPQNDANVNSQRSELPDIDDLENQSGSGEVSGFTEPDGSEAGSTDFDVSGSGSGSGDSDSDSFSDIGVDYKAYNNRGNGNRRGINNRNIIKGKGYTPDNYAHPRKARYSFYNFEPQDKVLNTPDTREIGSIKAVDNDMENTQIEQSDSSLNTIETEDSSQSEVRSEVEQTDKTNDMLDKNDESTKVILDNPVLRNERNHSTEGGEFKESKNTTQSNITAHKQFRENNKGKAFIDANQTKQFNRKPKNNESMNPATNLKNSYHKANEEDNLRFGASSKNINGMKNNDQNRFNDDNNEKSIEKIESALKDEDESNKVADEVADAIEGNVSNDSNELVDDKDSSSNVDKSDAINENQEKPGEEKNVTAIILRSSDNHGKKIPTGDSRKGHLHKIKAERNGEMEEIEFYHNKSGLYETDNSFADINLLRNESLFSLKLQNDSDAINNTLYNYLHKNNWSNDTYKGKTGPLGDSVYSYLEWSEQVNVTSDKLQPKKGTNNESLKLYDEETNKNENPYVEQESLDDELGKSHFGGKAGASGTITSFDDQTRSESDTSNAYLNQDETGKENSLNSKTDDTGTDMNWSPDFNMTTDASIKTSKHDAANWNNVSFYADQSLNQSNANGEASGGAKETSNIENDQSSSTDNTSYVNGEQDGSQNESSNAYNDASAPTGENSNIQNDSGEGSAKPIPDALENDYQSGILNSTNSTSAEQESLPKDNNNDNKTDINDKSNKGGEEGSDTGGIEQEASNGLIDSGNKNLNPTDSESSTDNNDREQQLLKDTDANNSSDFDYLHKNPTPQTADHDNYGKHRKEELDSKEVKPEKDLLSEESKNKTNGDDGNIEKYFPFLHHNPEPNVTDFYSLHQVPKHVKIVGEIKEMDGQVKSSEGENETISINDDKSNTQLYKEDSTNDTDMDSNGNTNVSMTPIDLSNEEPGSNVTIAVDNDNASIKADSNNNDTNFSFMSTSGAGQPSLNMFLYDTSEKQAGIPNQAGNFDAASSKASKSIPLKDIGKLINEKKEEAKKNGNEKINLDVHVYSSGVTNIYVDNKGKLAVKKVGSENDTNSYVNKNKLNTHEGKNMLKKAAKPSKNMKTKDDLDEDIMEDADAENIFVDNKAYTDANGHQTNQVSKQGDMKTEKNKEKINLNQSGFESAKVEEFSSDNSDNNTKDVYADRNSWTKKPRIVSNDGPSKNQIESSQQNGTENAKTGNISSEKANEFTSMSNASSTNLTSSPHLKYNNVDMKKGGDTNITRGDKNISHIGSLNISGLSDIKSIQVDEIWLKTKKVKKANFDKDKGSSPITEGNTINNHGNGDNKNDHLNLNNDSSANAVSQSALKIVEDLVDIINTTHSKKPKNNVLKENLPVSNNGTSSKGEQSSKRRHLGLPGTDAETFIEEDDASVKGSDSETQDKKKLHILEITSMLVNGMKKQRVANKMAANKKRKMDVMTKGAQTYVPASKRYLSKRKSNSAPSSLISVVKRDAYEQPAYQVSDLPDEDSELIPPYKEKETIIELQNPIEKEEVDASSLIPPQYVEVETEKVLPKSTAKEIAESVKRNNIPSPEYSDESPEEIALIRTRESSPSFIAQPIDPELSAAVRRSVKKSNIAIPPDYISNSNDYQQKSIPQPILAALQKSNEQNEHGHFADKLRVIETAKVEDDSIKTDADNQNDVTSQTIESIDKRDKIWTDDQEENASEDSNVIEDNPDIGSQDQDVSPQEESVVKQSRPYPLEFQSPPSAELRSNILDMLASSETSAVDASRQSDTEQASGNNGVSEAESGSAESWYDTSGDDVASAEQNEENTSSTKTKRDMIAKTVILNVIRQAEKHLNGISNGTGSENKRTLIQKLINEHGKTTNLVDKAVDAEDSHGSLTEGSGISSGSGQSSGNSEDEEGDNSLPYAKAKSDTGHIVAKNLKKSKRKITKESKNNIVKQLVKEMARAAIESVEDNDSHLVVKKSDIADVENKDESWEDEGNYDIVKRSQLTERDFVNAANDKDIHTALKLLVNTLLNEGPSSVPAKGDLLRVKRMETEKKLETDMLASSTEPESDGSGEEAKKSKVVTDVKDFVGLAEELSQSDFLTPYKHDVIANKLEGDLVKNLKLTKQQSATIFKEEDNLLKASEMEYIKDKIDREFSRNDGASRKEKIAAIKKIVKSMPLSKEDSDDLTRTIKESNWLNVGSHSKRRRSHMKHKPT